MTARPDTATIVFTDLVGSTSLRASLGEEQADALRAEHDHLLTTAVEEHGGRVVKSLGDGIMAVFSSASDAIASAVSIQVAAAAYSESPRGIAPIHLRVGLSTGDVSWDASGDCFGTPVIEAARLEAAAEPGQIVCSTLTRLITRGRGGFEFVDIGELDLKGLPEPLSACEVTWSFSPGDEGPTVPLPGSLDVTADGIFVGRADELRELGSLIQPSDGSAGLAFVCLAGEPGIGKTRLAAEVAGLRHAAGGTVLFGRCEEDLPVPFRPFVEALNHFVGNLPADELADRLGPDPASLGLLCPDIWSLIAGLERPARVSAELEQLRLFDAVRGWLAQNQILFVIDDVHWASRPTLQLLRHLLRSQDPSSSVIVASARDAEMPPELVALLDDTALSDSVSVVSLGGLNSNDLSRLAASHEAVDISGHDLLERSGGNPFFVRALLDDAVGGGSGTAEAAVRRRVQRVPEATRVCLTTGALLGLEFDLRTLASVNGLSLVAALDDVELAVDARLVREVGPNVFGFAHALVRDAILLGLSDTRRLQLHDAVGSALEESNEGARSEIAYHYGQAAVDRPSRERAVHWHRQAAELAQSVAAYSDAADHLRQAAELSADDDPLLSLELELDSYYVVRDTGAYEQEIDERVMEIADIARGHGEHALEARALQIGAEGCIAVGRSFSEPLVEGILALDPDRIDDANARLRFKTLVPFVWFYTPLGPPPGAATWIEQCVQECETLGDVQSRSWSHQNRAHLIAFREPANVAAMVEALERAVTEGVTAGNVRLAAHSAWLLSARHLEAGSAEGAKRAADIMRLYAERGDNPWAKYIYFGSESVRLFAHGRLPEAEARAYDADEVADDVHGFDASGAHGQQMFAIRREQDRLEEIRPMVELPIRRGASLASMWRPGAAALFADLGMVDQAGAQLAELVGEDGPEIPVDSRYTTSLSFMTDACVVTEDVLRASVLHDALQPYQGLNVVMPGLTCFGPVDRYLGRLAAVMGDADDAMDHFHSALGAAQSMASPLFEAQVMVDLASLSSHIGDHLAAAQHAEAALAAVGSLDLRRVRRDAQSLLSGPGSQTHNES